MGVLYFTLGAPTPVALLGDYVLKHIDVNTFLRLLLAFGPNAKKGPLGLALLGMIAVGTVLSWLYALLVRVPLPVHSVRPSGREWFTTLGFAVSMTLIATLLFWNELRQNQFGLPLDWAVVIAILCLLGDFSAYALTLCLTYRVLLPKQIQPDKSALVQRRRQLLARAGVFSLGLGAGAASFGLAQRYLQNYTSYDGMKTWTHNDMVPPITPNDQHYVVTQNAVDPTPNIALWRLEVSGLVQRPGNYTYEELQMLPSTSRAITLECIANGIGDHLISTAIWQGVSLSTLLEHHGGKQATARYAAFYSVDGYNISLPLDEVLAADALLAWRMNGAELPMRHGYPLRVLIPGRYGEENPKWLTRVELTDHFVQGLYSSQGWYNGPLHTISRIDHPRGKLALGQTAEIGGIAFAGNRGIERVEVSVDSGATWQEASLDQPLSSDSWRFWQLSWRPSQARTYTLVARATDGARAVQTSQQQGTVPNGATGYHQITVTVE
jgi:DMSO/TMAO reductase YedYZ molybdopterin-dependent catalytic subunit